MCSLSMGVGEVVGFLINVWVSCSLLGVWCVVCYLASGVFSLKAAISPSLRACTIRTTIMILFVSFMSTAFILFAEIEHFTFEEKYLPLFKNNRMLSKTHLFRPILAGIDLAISVYQIAIYYYYYYSLHRGGSVMLRNFLQEGELMDWDFDGYLEDIMHTCGNGQEDVDPNRNAVVVEVTAEGYSIRYLHKDRPPSYNECTATTTTSTAPAHNATTTSTAPAHVDTAVTS